jgi:hypothetical protein
MAIVTGIQPFTLWRNVGFAVLCAVFGVWGWYDYAIKIPRLEIDSAIYEKAKDTRSTLEKQAETKPLDDAQIKQMEDAKKDLDGIRARYGSTVPAKPAVYDRPMQLWLYIVGCGVLGVPMFVWPIIRTRMKPYRLEGDGTLRTPSESVSPADIVDIDMSRWCSPTGDRRSTWTAKVVLQDGRTILLDDHDHKNMHLIIGAIAHRLHPDEWTLDAKRVGGQSSDDAANTPAS